MARRYNHIVRYLESWIYDLEDPEKQFTDAERWAVVRAIAQCQFDCSLEPLQSLPLEIRRGLSILTMGEQLLAIMDRVHSYKSRGQNAAISAAKAPNSASKPSDVVKAEEREKEQAERKTKQDAELEAQRAEMKLWGAKTSLELYYMQLAAAKVGNEAMRERFPDWENLCKRNGI